MPDCLFCKIAANKTPCAKVFENERVMAFLDISPVNPGHTLVIPKKHYKNMEEIPADELREVIAAVKKVGSAIKQGLQAPGYNATVNNDPAAGQVIPHLHFHIIPRHQGDGLKLWPQGEYKEGEAGETAEKIKSAI